MDRKSFSKCSPFIWRVAVAEQNQKLIIKILSAGMPQLRAKFQTSLLLDIYYGSQVLNRTSNIQCRHWNLWPKANLEYSSIKLLAAFQPYSHTQKLRRKFKIEFDLIWIKANKPLQCWADNEYTYAPQNFINAHKNYPSNALKWLFIWVIIVKLYSLGQKPFSVKLLNLCTAILANVHT